MSTVKKTKNGPVVFIEFPTEIKSPICGKFFPCRLLLKRNSVNYFFQVGKLGSDNFYADSKKPIKHFLRHCKFVLEKKRLQLQIVVEIASDCVWRIIGFGIRVRILFLIKVWDKVWDYFFFFQLYRNNIDTHKLHHLPIARF